MTEEQARLTREAWAAVRNFACANDPEHVVALAGAVDALLAAEPAVSLEEQLATAYHEGYERGLRDAAFERLNAEQVAAEKAAPPPGVAEVELFDRVNAAQVAATPAPDAELEELNKLLLELDAQYYHGQHVDVTEDKIRALFQRREAAARGEVVGTATVIRDATDELTPLHRHHRVVNVRTSLQAGDEVMVDLVLRRDKEGV
jgi:hypothetical protein